MAQGIDEVKTDEYAYVGLWQGPCGIGTAELIAPDWIITAKHVAENLIKNPEVVVMVRFTGPNGKASARAIKAFGCPRADIALAQLDHPTNNIPTLALAQDRIPPAEEVEISVLGHFGGKHVIRGAFCRAEEGGIRLRKVDKGNLAHAIDGDSGGAWIIDRQDVERDVLVGLLRGGGIAPQPAIFREWIDRT